MIERPWAVLLLLLLSWRVQGTSSNRKLLQTISHSSSQTNNSSSHTCVDNFSIPNSNYANLTSVSYFQVDQYANVICNDCYSNEDGASNISVRCQQDGTWYTSLSLNCDSAQWVCVDDFTIPHSDHSNAGSSLFGLAESSSSCVSDSVTVTCDDWWANIEMQTTMSLYCLENGTWSTDDYTNCDAPYVITHV